MVVLRDDGKESGSYCNGFGVSGSKKLAPALDTCSNEKCRTCQAASPWQGSLYR